MTSFLLKIIGIISMLCDHTSYCLLGKFTYLNLIGRIAFPIFAFQSVQGYIHTKNFKNYIKRLCIFALISQIPFMLFLSIFSKDIYYLNIFFTFILGLLGLYLYEKSENKILGFVYVIATCGFAELINVDYGAFGVFLIFIFYFFSGERKNEISNIFIRNFLMIFSVLLLCFLKYLIPIIKEPNLVSTYLLCFLFTSLPIVLILFYNKKQGPKLKYFFYIFYPLHLVILYLIHLFI